MISTDKIVPTPIMRIFRSGDLIGIFNTSICLVHCLALPLLIALGATFMLHPAITISFVGVAVLSVLGAVRASGHRGIGILLWSSVVVFSIAILLEEHHPAFEAISLLASVALITGHLLNRRHIGLAKASHAIVQPVR